MQRSHSFVRLAMAAALLAGCQAGPTSTAGPSPTTVPTAIAAATATPTDSPATPSGSPIACPSNLPVVLASVGDLADPACYGTTELAIDGWLEESDIDLTHNEAFPSWTMPTSALFAASPTVEQWTFDFLMSMKVFGLPIVGKPGSGIDLAGPGRWVRLRGHFNDPEALACTPATPDTYPDEYAGPDCDRLLVVTGVDPIERPAPACPAESPLTLAAFLAADASCFVGREVRITGWEDVGEGFGGEAPVYPVTLDPSMRLAEAQLVSNRWESDLDQHVIFPWIMVGSGVQFDRSDLRVVVTGMLGHPAAEGCRPGTLEGWTWVPPISWAQGRCAHLFVITGVRALD